MELDFALLADAAQVSEGKMHVLGGGASILFRDQYPAPLGPLAVVFQLRYERSETESERELRLLVMDADGNPVLPEIKGSFMVGKPHSDVPRNVPLVIPIVIPLPPVPVLQRPGAYDVQILLDGRHLKTLPFAVAHTPSQPPTP